MDSSEHWEAWVGGLRVWHLPLVMPVMQLHSPIVLSGALPLGPHHTFHLLSVKTHYLFFPQAMWEPSTALGLSQLMI